MPSYLVTWRIDIEADTPEEAAKRARSIQLDPDNIASYYDVVDQDTEGLTVVDTLEEAYES